MCVDDSQPLTTIAIYLNKAREGHWLTHLLTLIMRHFPMSDYHQIYTFITALDLKISEWLPKLKFFNSLKDGGSFI